jgi:hypothetical protein
VRAAITALALALAASSVDCGAPECARQSAEPTERIRRLTSVYVSFYDQQNPFED